MKKSLIFALFALMSSLAFAESECGFDGKYVATTPEGNMRTVTLIGDKALLSVSDSQGQLMAPVQVRRIKAAGPRMHHCALFVTVVGLDDEPIVFGSVPGLQHQYYRIEGHTLVMVGQEGMHYTRKN